MEAYLQQTLLAGKEMLELLVELAEQKQEAIIENDREVIAELSQKELELTESLQDWEKERRQRMGTASLSELIEKADAKQKLKLDVLGEELVFLTEKLATLNMQNADLLRHALAYTEYCLSLFQTESATYGQKKEDLTFLDRKI